MHYLRVVDDYSKQQKVSTSFKIFLPRRLTIIAILQYLLFTVCEVKKKQIKNKFLKAEKLRLKKRILEIKISQKLYHKTSLLITPKRT